MADPLAIPTLHWHGGVVEAIYVVVGQDRYAKTETTFEGGLDLTNELIRGAVNKYTTNLLLVSRKAITIPKQDNLLHYNQPEYQDIP